MKRLLFWLTGYLPVRLINDGARPYLERYFVARLFGVTVYLHRFVGSDPDRGLHDHPWGWAVLLILAGWYLEERRGHDYGTRTFVPVRWVNVLTGDSFHRVVLPDEKQEAWTLFIHGGYTKGWGFWSDVAGHGKQRMAIWREHAYRTDERSGKEVWWTNAPKGGLSMRQPRGE
jgi:hypothetical protein